MSAYRQLGLLGSGPKYTLTVSKDLSTVEMVLTSQFIRPLIVCILVLLCVSGGENNSPGQQGDEINTPRNIWL